MIVVKIILLLNLITSLVNCINQVSVLMYKGGNACSSVLVGIPIKPTLSKSIGIEEFTYCGKYYFRFVRNSIIIGIEPDLILGIKDFKNKRGSLLYQGVYYMFWFQNQTVNPDSWQYICLAVSSNQMKIVWNGNILLNEPKVILSKEEFTERKIWIGGALFFDKNNKRRFEGMISLANFWNDSLEDNDLISITTNDDPITVSAEYNLLSMITPKNSSCMDYFILDENDALFQEVKPEKVILIEHKTYFDSAKHLCQGYGGNLTIPKNEEDMKVLSFSIQQSDVCNWAFLGLTKSTNNEILDLRGNVVTYLEWGINQPNGREFQQCISTSSDGIINDNECDTNDCFFCQIPEKSWFILRGQTPIDIERKYFVTINRKYTEIRGLTETECFWKEGKWKFGLHLKLDNETNKMPPVGLKNWNNGQKLKFTQCKKGEFTCHTYGHCISMNQRCDGHPDCPVDGSDENKCNIMTLSKGYDERYGSEKNVQAFIYMEVYDITDLDELHMSYTVHFKIQLKWFDSRIIFRNLKLKHYRNKLDVLEIKKIWSPKLYIKHSINAIVEAVHGTVMIQRNGSPRENALSEVDEDYLYPGNENPIIMINYFTIKLGCKFDLKW